MAQLDLRFYKPNLGPDLELGVVARVRQIKDADGNFPADPQEREVVIPAGIMATRTVDDLPPGTYRIEARLPSGEVLRETRDVTDEQQVATVIFQGAPSPHEWLSWQRLSGNVPSEHEYEAWLTKLANETNMLAKAKTEAARPIDETTIRRWTRLMRDTHITLHPLLKSVGELLGRAKAVVPDSLTMGETPQGAPPRVEFEVLQGDSLSAGLPWEAVASAAGWRTWRTNARTDETLDIYRNDDRQVTLWQITQRNRSKTVMGPTGKLVPVRSLAVMQRGDGVDAIPLPLPWPMNTGAPPASLEILREAGVSDAGRITLTVRDESIGSLIMYLNNGQISDAATVLAEADRGGRIEQLISEKFNNPFAASAAAYVGIATLSDDATPPRWTGWLANLKNFFEWLPDGAIIHAAYYLKTARSREDLDTALASFKIGYRRGVPFYAVGLQHLMNGLYTFSEKDEEAKTMYDKVSAVASRVDRNRAFTQITIAA